MLSNASLDLAFHDTYNKKICYFNFFENYLEISAGTLLATNVNKFKHIQYTGVDYKSSRSTEVLESYLINKFKSKNKDKGCAPEEFINYIERFFLGLLEGDGTITMDYLNDKTKRIRIIIALKNNEENKFMLYIISKYIGGRVVIERKDKYITWYATNTNDIKKVFNITKKYPFLTTRKECQLEFAMSFLKSGINYKKTISKNEFKILRDNKYNSQAEKLTLRKNCFILPDYFQAWLSGFIEAEGHFKLVKKSSGAIGVSQFVIGQNYEEHVLKAILIYFNKEENKISTTINKEGVTYFKIHIGGKDVRHKLHLLFESYPLLGDKKTKYLDWFNKHVELLRPCY